MLDIRLIRNDTGKVTDALLKRMEGVDFTAVIALDDRRRRLISEVDAERAKRKDLAKQSGALRAKGEDSSAIEANAAGVNTKIEELELELASAEEELKGQLSQFPNIPDERVAAGGKENNRVVREWGVKPPEVPNAQDHVEICKRLGLVDYDRGAKLSGSGFWIYKGLGAALEWALLDYFCRSHFSAGYEFLLPPHLLDYECGYAAGQFPKFEEDVFHLRRTGSDRERFLLPTSETAVLNVYRDEILESDRLPIKCFAYSPCYRREGGGHRAEERGTIRGHQFNKVEMFQFTKPEQAEEALNELVRRAEGLVESLGLHYRTSLLAAGDSSSAMALTYDIEVWLPSVGIYKEVSSVSWARDFQARRANIRYRPEARKNTEFVHTLNGSGLATSRLLPAIVEQFQQADGSVLVPKPLQSWVGTDRISATSWSGS